MHQSNQTKSLCFPGQCYASPYKMDIVGGHWNIYVMVIEPTKAIYNLKLSHRQKKVIKSHLIAYLKSFMIGPWIRE